MEFIAYNKAQLLELANKNAFRQMKHLPISTYRVLSHTNNPRLQENDPLLYIAYQNGEMIGYLGAIPDEIIIKGKYLRSAYLSSLWVNPQHRGKGIASLLVQKMATHYPFSLLTEYVEPTKPIYDKSGVYNKTPHVKEGIRIYFQYTLHEILTQKIPALSKVKSLLKIADSLLNYFLRLFPSKQTLLTDKIIVEKASSFSPDMLTFIHQNNADEFFNQDAEKFNWILRYPWVLSLSNSTEADIQFNKKYHFSSNAKSFTNIVIVGRNEQKQIRFILFLTQREGKAKLPFVYYDDSKIVTEALLNWLKTENIKVFTCFHPILSDQLFRLKFKAAFKNKIVKKTLISKKLMDILPKKFYIQDGDGDSVFT